MLSEQAVQCSLPFKKREHYIIMNKKKDKKISIILAQIASVKQVYTSHGGYQIVTSEGQTIYSGERGNDLQIEKEYELFCYLSRNGN